MRRLAFTLILACFTTAALPLHAADGDGKGAKKKKKDAEAAPGGTSMVGDLCVKPKGAGDGIVCGLIARVNGKEEIIKLSADGDVAKELTDMRSKGMRVKVSGKLADGSLAVQKVEEAKRR